MGWYPRSRPSNFELIFCLWGFSTTLITNLTAKTRYDHLFRLFLKASERTFPSGVTLMHLCEYQVIRNLEFS